MQNTTDFSNTHAISDSDTDTDGHTSASPGINTRSDTNTGPSNTDA